MERTRRTPAAVMQAAADALTALEFADQWSADADHLKTTQQAHRAMEAGFVFFTLDPSEDVDQHADSYDWATLSQKFAAVRDLVPWAEEYRGRTVRLSTGAIEFDERTIACAAVKYGKAMKRAISLAKFVDEDASQQGRPFELELSVDETAEPTTPAEHYVIAEQLRKAGVRLVSLAPRLVGDFEKGVDYKGDLAALEASLKVHVEIAERLGPYKISLHSGSDKLSMYPVVARVTHGRFHVKTAGTSYLEAIRVAAHHDEDLFRAIIAYSREHYGQDKATYHVSAVVDDIAGPDEISDAGILEELYLERWDDVAPGRGFTAPGRQILHCTFGSVMTNPRLGPALVQLLQDRPDEYREILKQHFVRHLQPLKAA